MGEETASMGSWFGFCVDENTVWENTLQGDLGCLELF